MCDHRQPRGWYCKIPEPHDGSCPLVPRWWNIRWQLFMRGMH